MRTKNIKSKHDYNIFSKQELVDFLTKHEANFLYIGSPFDFMINLKMDDVHKKIDINLENSKKISNEFKRTNDGLKYLIEIKKNHEEWNKLDKEYDKLYRLRFNGRYDNE